MKKVEEYRGKLDVARIRVKACFEKFSPISESQVSVITEKAKLKLPKIELIKFGGEVKDCFSFWSQFSRIHEDTISDEMDVQYFTQSTIISSRELGIVDSYPSTEKNYAIVADNWRDY
ncbi:uncharacterized protein TNIN_121591 [Trichonephila inaurata madagascariensis]|uniref:Uncharacterized protein n=1 Tax=Trichonephila inaurata madagascariensis TaxID=2747483 RepID=A0A8X6ME44_9ARAC|nr:uncharacterized protein TNIN_121591 [Trichonephila inaurata madagascariensis]